jgi:hypothetical protein
MLVTSDHQITIDSLSLDNARCVFSLRTDKLPLKTMCGQRLGAIANEEECVLWEI